MKTLPITSDMDIDSMPQIDRFCDSQNIYIIETDADYATLPQPIIDMINKSKVDNNVAL